MQSSEENRFGRERRRYPRVKAKIPVELQPHGTAFPLRTATDEISLCGCYIESMFTMNVGTKVEVAFSLDEIKVRAAGIVATAYPQVGNGIDFISMEPEARLKLHAFISALEEKQSSDIPYE